MAKKKTTGVNKSQFIRDMLSQNPKADYATVKAKGEEQGLKIVGSLYYMVKSKTGKAKRRARRKSAEAASSTMVGNPVEAVRKVKALAAEVGGLKNLIQLATLLAE